MSAGLVAVSRVGKNEISREPQNARAVKWLLEQSGGQVVVVTPSRIFRVEASGDLLRILALFTTPGAGSAPVASTASV